MSSIRAVLFDNDGVMVGGDLSPVLTARYGIPEEVQSAFWEEHFPPAARGESDILVSLALVLEQWGVPLQPREFLELWCATESIRNELAAKFVEVLNSSGIVTALATNQEVHRTEYLRTTLQFDGLFTHVFASYALGAMKPEAMFFKAIAERLGIPPNQILFIDDSPVNVEAARKLGLHSVQYEFDPERDNRRSFLDALRGISGNVDRCLEQVVGIPH